MLGMIADPLEVVADAHGPDAFAQIDSHRLSPRDGEDGLFLDLALHRVDHGISGDNALAELDIAIDQSLNRICDLALGKAAHFGDLARDFLQIGIEGLGSMVDPSGRRDVIGHIRYPKRPVM